MIVENESPLSREALKALFALEIENRKTHSVDFKLQVLNIKKNDPSKSASSGSQVYTASLSDGENKYNNFVIVKGEADPQVDPGDVLEISKVCTARLDSQKNRIFIVKKYTITQKNLAVVGTPKPIKDDYTNFPQDKRYPAMKEFSETNNNKYSGIGLVEQSKQNYLSNSSENTGSNINSLNPYSQMDNMQRNSQNLINSIKSENSFNNEFVKVEENPNNSGIKTEINDKQINTQIHFPNFGNSNSPTSSLNNDTPHKKLNHMPLKTLTTFSKDICILVRCIKKTSIRSFNGGAGGAGILFSFNVIDEEGSEMQITCFNRACEKFYVLIKENCVYEIIGGYIKLNEKKYTCIKSEYTMIIYENAKITEKEDDGKIKETHYNYVKIGEIANIQPNSIIDIFAYVLEAPEKIIKNTKIGEQPIRKIILADDSEFKIEFTLWKVFTDLDIKQGSVISVKAVKIGDYNGRSLSTVDHSVICIDPPGRETTDLRNFCSNYQEEWSTFNEIVGGNAVENSVTSPIHTIREVLSFLDTYDHEDKIPITKIKATICTILHSEKNFYPGCPDKTCKKKLYSFGSDTWQCNYCKKSTNKPFYYYRFSVRIKDYSGEHWLDIFGDFGQKLFKISCEDYKDLVYSRNEEKLNEITNHLEFRTFYFIVKPKMQNYNNISKKKLNCYKVETIEPAEESRRILKCLQEVFK
jgi:replication factor A1